MLATERQRRIVDYVSSHGTARIHDLRGDLQLSLSTLRRDLQEIERRGAIRRVHGGVVFVEEKAQPPILQRSAFMASQKRRIGAAAAGLVGNGETIIVTSGSTTQAIVPHLASKTNLTVITNAVNVAYMLADQPQIAVIVLGGWLNHTECYALGYLTELCLRDLRADKVFHGVYGLEPESGFTSTSIQDVQTDRSLIGIARELIVVADHTKFERSGPVLLAPLGAASTVVTDDEAPDAAVDALRGQGVRVILA